MSYELLIVKWALMWYTDSESKAGVEHPPDGWAIEMVGAWTECRQTGNYQGTHRDTTYKIKLCREMNCGEFSPSTFSHHLRSVTMATAKQTRPKERCWWHGVPGAWNAIWLTSESDQQGSGESWTSHSHEVHTVPPIALIPSNTRRQWIKQWSLRQGTWVKCSFVLNNIKIIIMHVKCPYVWNASTTVLGQHARSTL